jgi:hypothetical protein
VTSSGSTWGAATVARSGIGTVLGLKSAGWTFLPRVAVAVAVLLGVYRVFVRLVLLRVHLDSPG